MTGPSPGDPLTPAPEKTRLPPCRYFRCLFMKLLVHADSRTSRLGGKGENGEMGLSTRCVALGDVTDWEM